MGSGFANSGEFQQPARNLYRQFAKLALQRLTALAVAGVACGVLDGFVLAVAKVIGHLGFQRLLDQQLGELLEQPIFANQVFRLSVISQQAVQQLLGYGFLRYGHHRSWQCGSFLLCDRVHKHSYTPGPQPRGSGGD